MSPSSAGVRRIAALPAAPADPDEETSETVDADVRRHGAGKGSRWPALLLVLTLLAIAAFAVWWTLLR